MKPTQRKGNHVHHHEEVIVIDPLTAHTLFQHRHAELVAEADAYRRTRTARKGRPVRRRLRWTARFRRVATV